MTEREVAASEFKAKCLALLDDVAATGAEFVVTKRGRRVAKVVPVESSEDLRARAAEGLRASITYHVTDDDLIAPIDVEWDALG